MANTERGEVEIGIGGKAYTFRFTVNALCELEVHTGERAMPFCARFGRGDCGLADMRAVVWAGLRDRHADLTIDEAGALVDRARRDGVPLFVSVMEALTVALAELMGENPPKPATSRPKKKKAGKHSSRRPSSPASTPSDSGG